ncbi:MAG: hypothetical protein ACLFUK_06060 [Halanaerobium sp.]
MSLKIKKNLSILLLTLLVFTPFLQLNRTQAAGIIPLNDLREIEKILYGSVSDKSIIERVDEVEKTVYNSVQSGSIVERTEKLIDDLLITSEDSTSLLFLFNTIEWSIRGELAGGNLIERLEGLEKMVSGENNEGPLKDRIEELYNLTIKGREMPVQKVDTRNDQLIRVELLEKINSNTASRGEKVSYQVLEDIKVKDALIIPKGSRGELEITQIEEAGKMGKDGDIKIGFPSLKTIDGTDLAVAIQEEAQEENESQKLAIGASVLGTALLGLPGVVAGYFVEGKDEEIPSGSEMYIQVTENKELFGVVIK